MHFNIRMGTNCNGDIREVKRNFKKFKYNTRKHLAKLDLEAILNNKSGSVCWDTIKSEIDSIIENLFLSDRIRKDQKQNTYASKLLGK